MEQREFENQKQYIEWSLFLFDFCISLIENKSIIKKRYEPKNFGSWTIEFSFLRITYDGKEDYLSIAKKKNNVWDVVNDFSKKEITYFLLKEIVKS